MKGPTKSRFQHIYDEGFRVSGRLCRVIYTHGTDLLGIATSKSIGNTPRRNRVKRRFRAALTKVPNCIPPNLDVVIQIKGVADRASWDEIQADILQVFEGVRRRWESEQASS